MNLEYSRLLSTGFAITWRHRWLWVLGVFAGGGGGFSFNYAQPTRRGGGAEAIGNFVSQNLGLILAIAGVIVLIAIVALVVSWIAQPASYWSALELEAGAGVGLRDAWRFGRTRMGRYALLWLLTAAIFVGVAVAIGVLALLTFLAFQASIALGFVLLLPVVAVAVIVIVVLSLGLSWSGNMPVILDVPAGASIRASWQLFRRHKLDTFVLGLVLGALTFFIYVAIVIGAAIIAIPGIVMVAFGLGSNSTVLIGSGALWVILIGGGLLVVGGGFLGALRAVVTTLACRDLLVMDGRLPPAGLMPSADQLPPAAPASGLMPA